MSVDSTRPCPNPGFTRTATGPRYPAARSSPSMPGDPTFGVTRSRRTVSRALSRNTSEVRRITGGSAPPGNPARRARNTSFPLTASIHMPASRITSRILCPEFAFMA